MTFFPKKPIIAGVDFTSSSIKIALLTKKSKKWVPYRFEEVPLHVNLLDILPKDALCVSSLSSREVLVRSMDLPLKKERDIEKALEFQAEPILPFPLEKAFLHFQKIEETPEGVTGSLFAVKKEQVTKHLDLAKEHRFEPESVSTHPLAIASLTPFFEIKEEKFLFLHLSGKEGTILCIKNGSVLISKAIENDKFEIQKTIIALSLDPKAKDTHSLYVLCDDPHLVPQIQEMTQKKVLVPRCPDISEENLSKYALALGAAMTATQKKFLNFRQQELAYPYPLKRIGKPLLVYLTAGCILFVSLFALESKMISSYEKRVLGKLGVENRNMLELKMDEIENAIEKMPTTFPLLPCVPKVSDLIAWFSHDFPFDSISIETFNYTMVDRPTFERKHEHYQIKVELSFKTPSAASANAFHEFLLAPNPFTDPKKEVVFSCEKGMYVVTFYLKDKTRYL